MQYKGFIKNALGNEIGEVTRTFVRHANGEFEVHHDYFKIDDKKEHGKKTGETMLRQAIQTYEKLGVNKITVDAAWVGQYTWATFGFNWDAATAKEMGERLGDFLASHSIASDRAARVAARASKRAWGVAAVDLDGIVVKTHSEGKTIDCHLGKAFLLNGGMWSGELSLDPASETYQRAKKRIGL